MLIIKLHACDFSLAALRVFHSYLFNWKQSTKTTESYSSSEAVLFGVPQRSNLGPVLINIIICNLFIIIDNINIANYADDYTPFVSGDTPLHAITSVENMAEKLLEWFAKNHMKVKYDKCNPLMSTLTSISVKVKDSVIQNSKNKMPFNIF